MIDCLVQKNDGSDNDGGHHGRHGDFLTVIGTETR